MMFFVRKIPKSHTTLSSYVWKLNMSANWCQSDGNLTVKLLLWGKNETTYPLQTNLVHYKWQKPIELVYRNLQLPINIF